MSTTQRGTRRPVESPPNDPPFEREPDSPPSPENFVTEETLARQGKVCIRKGNVERYVSVRAWQLLQSSPDGWVLSAPEPKEVTNLKKQQQQQHGN